MKRILLYTTIVISILSCGDSEEERKKFLQTYKEIIVARNTHTDTASANLEINRIYKKMGYTEESFRKKYFEYARDSHEFLIMLDSARRWAQNEIKQLESKLKKDSVVFIGAPVDTAGAKFKTKK